MNLSFVKMHGCGNDYVYLDAVSDPAIEGRISRPQWKRLVRAMSDRHTGIGGDGVIVVCRPGRAAAAKGADLRMRMFNADGSEGEMCGNGVRCVAKFAHDRLGVRGKPMRVQTEAGILAIDYTLARGRLSTATADIGRPRLRPADSGVRVSDLSWIDTPRHTAAIECGDDPTVWVGTLVSMGNPHFVIFGDAQSDQFAGRRELAKLDLAAIGPAIENHPAFRDRINVHFVTVESKREATMRTWERGSGITQACGTGACAVLVAGVLTGRLGRAAVLHLPGGDLDIRWDHRSRHVFMTGPAVEVFAGEWKG